MAVSVVTVVRIAQCLVLADSTHSRMRSVRPHEHEAVHPTTGRSSRFENKIAPPLKRLQTMANGAKCHYRSNLVNSAYLGSLHTLCEPHGARVSPDKDACVVALGAAAGLMSDGLQLQLWVLEEQRHITVAASRLSARGGLAVTPISWFKLTQK